MSLELFVIAPQARPWALGLALGLGFLGAVLPSLERTRLQDVDELTHAKVAQNAALRGHWSPLWLDGHPFYEKPPLLPWLTALAVKASGQPYASWPYRVWPALGAALCVGLLGALLCWATGRVSLGAASALWLALQPDFLFHARFLTHDTLFLASALAALALMLRALSRGGRAWIWPGLALSLAFAFKSWFVLALCPALAWGLGGTLKPGQRAGALARLLALPALTALAWLALYTHWLGPRFLAQEWQSNLWGRALGRTTELDPEGQFSFYVKWALWSAPGLLPWALALPLAWHPAPGKDARALLRRCTFAWIVTWLLGLCLVRAQTINYLLPLELALCLGMALAWDAWNGTGRSALSGGLMLSVVAMLFSGASPYYWVPLALGAPLAWGLRSGRPIAWMHQPKNSPAWAWLLLLSCSLPAAWGMLVRPLDANAQLVQVLRAHPAEREGQPLLVIGSPTQAIDFYSGYKAQWLAGLPAQRPEAAALVKTKQGWRYFGPKEGPGAQGTVERH